jgi:hypothetical protein
VNLLTEQLQMQDVDPDAGVPPMSQLNFGVHTLDAAYRQSIPPFYTSAMIVSTFLGHNQEHPGQEEWLEIASDSASTYSSSGGSEWKQDEDSSGSDGSSDYSCASGDALTAESSDVPEPESSDMSESDFSDSGSECSDASECADVQEA